VVEEIGGVKSYGQSENIIKYTTIYSNTLLDILIYCEVEMTNNSKYRWKQNKHSPERCDKRAEYKKVGFRRSKTEEDVENEINVSATFVLYSR